VDTSLRSKAEEVKKLIDQLVVLIENYKTEQDTFKQIETLTKIHTTYGKITTKLLEIIKTE